MGTLEELQSQVQGGFGEGVEASVDKDNVVVQLGPAQIVRFLTFARDRLGCDLLTAVTAVDNGDAFELLYHLTSVRPQSPDAIDPAFPGYLLARVRVEKDQEEPEVASATDIYPGADQQEREIWDLMGIKFRGHPNLQRILLWEGFPGHPLRKDWVPLNAEIPWHLAGLTGFGGETMADAPAIARIAADGSGISEPVPMGTTPEAFEHPATRPPKPTERLHLKIGQGGITDYERPAGPPRLEELPPGVRDADPTAVPIKQEAPAPPAAEPAGPEARGPGRVTELRTISPEELKGRLTPEQERTLRRDMRSDLVQLNIGPHHPSTHGVLHFFVTLDGEVVVELKVIYGYLHRSMEKLMEGRTYVGSVAITDRMDYTAAMLNNWGWCLCCEKLAGLEVNERANCLRTIAGELSRLSSHLIGTGVFGQDVGVLVTSVMWGFNWREEVLSLLDDLSGARMMYNFMRPGGVNQDCPDFWPHKVRETMDKLPGHIADFHRLMTTNEIFHVRTKGIGVLSAEDALAHSATGPTLRGSGVRYDIRKAHPYGIYSDLDFEVPVGENGDCFDRYMVRINEMEQSRSIILQALDRLEQTEPGNLGKPPKVFKPPPGDAYAEVEGAKGCLGIYLKSAGASLPYRAKLRSPGFLNLQTLPGLVSGWKIADVIAIFGSLDINMGEVDR